MSYDNPEFKNSSSSESLEKEKPERTRILSDQSIQTHQEEKLIKPQNIESMTVHVQEMFEIEKPK